MTTLQERNQQLEKTYKSIKSSAKKEKKKEMILPGYDLTYIFGEKDPDKLLEVIISEDYSGISFDSDTKYHIFYKEDWSGKNRKKDDPKLIYTDIFDN